MNRKKWINRCHLNWIKNEKDAFLRENKIAHITASAWGGKQRQEQSPYGVS